MVSPIRTSHVHHHNNSSLSPSSLLGYYLQKPALYIPFDLNLYQCVSYVTLLSCWDIKCIFSPGSHIQVQYISQCTMIQYIFHSNTGVRPSLHLVPGWRPCSGMSQLLPQHCRRYNDKGQCRPSTIHLMPACCGGGWRWREGGMDGWRHSHSSFAEVSKWEINGEEMAEEANIFLWRQSTELWSCYCNRSQEPREQTLFTFI